MQLTLGFIVGYVITILLCVLIFYKVKKVGGKT